MTRTKTAREMLRDYGLSEYAIDTILHAHAHERAEDLRRAAATGDLSGLTRIYLRAAADFFDPHATGDPLLAVRAVEENPRHQPDPCPHCPDGHTPPDHGQTWGAYVAPVRDGDGQPMQIIVARSAGAHVAESDAVWIRARLNGGDQ